MFVQALDFLVTWHPHPKPSEVVAATLLARACVGEALDVDLPEGQRPGRYRPMPSAALHPRRTGQSRLTSVKRSIMVDHMDVEQLTALARATASEDPLVGLDATVQVRKEMERVEAVLVRRARNQGATWVDIAAVLGVSKQAIHKKYGGRGLFGSQK